MHIRNIAFVLVPGSFSPPSFYEKVVPLLEAKGYEALPTELLSAAIADTRAPATMYDDAAHINATVTGLLDQGKNVVLAVNSYAGFPGSEAVKGLSRQERQEAIDNGAGELLGLVYLASFLPQVGESQASINGPALPSSFYTEPPVTWMTLPHPSPEFAATVFSDLPTDLQEHYYSQMLDQARVSFTNELTYPGYLHIPSTFLVSEADHIIPPASQHAMIDAANAQGANVREVSIDAGHIAMLSYPEKVVEVLLQAAGVKKIGGCKRRAARGSN